VSLPGEYFDDLYASGPDPWGFADRWYERRKRDLTLALLPEPSYGTGFEPGCSIGVLTRELAARCERLVASDVAAAAVHAAQERCADLPHVQVRQGSLPGDWPAEALDLVVLSEVGYYFDRATAARVADLACDAATVLAVHWRHPVADYPIGGDDVHALLTAAADRHGLHRLGGYRDEDVVAEVWSRDPRSVATRGGLS
jgi:hypothetical protein